MAKNQSKEVQDEDVKEEEPKPKAPASVTKSVRYMIIKPSHPIERISNSLFAIKKGEVMKVPGGYEPSATFQVFNDYNEAMSTMHNAPIEMPARSKEGITTTKTISSKLRQVKYPATEDEPERIGYMLRDKDIPEFLSHASNDLVSDLKLLDDIDTLQKLLEVEKKCDKRKTVLEELERRLK